MKTYHLAENVGKSKHVVSFHNGEKKHKDGSRFFDVAIFSNKRKLERFTKTLQAEGYTKS